MTVHPRTTSTEPRILHVVAEVNGESLHLYAEKAVFIPASRTLMIADLHFGKINHFRLAGIAAPAKANDKNTETLIDLINLVKPERTLFLGDLFHSHFNEEWNVVGQILKHFKSCSFELIRGNHDILSQLQYQRHGIVVHEGGLKVGNFWLTHEPMEQPHPELYNLAGHIHPGVTLMGKGRQRLTLPCFYFGKSSGILPAFGSFTGLARVTPKKEDQIFVIAEGKVLKV